MVEKMLVLVIRVRYLLSVVVFVDANEEMWPWEIDKRRLFPRPAEGRVNKH